MSKNTHRVLSESRFDSFIQEYWELCKKHGVQLISEGEAIEAVVSNSFEDDTTWGPKWIRESSCLIKDSDLGDMSYVKFVVHFRRESGRIWDMTYRRNDEPGKDINVIQENLREEYQKRFPVSYVDLEVLEVKELV